MIFWSFLTTLNLLLYFCQVIKNVKNGEAKWHLQNGFQKELWRAFKYKILFCSKKLYFIIKDVFMPFFF